MARTIAQRSDIIPVLAEIFRTHGYEGASLSVISEATGLGKGSLYHFFPGGKEEMADAVLAEIECWFRTHVFQPLRETGDARDALERMFDAVDGYFKGGGRVCVVGVFAVSDVRDRFGASVHRYFQDWIEALASPLVRLGRRPEEAQAHAEDVVAGIQGGLVLARALNDASVFKKTLERIKSRTLHLP